MSAKVIPVCIRGGKLGVGMGKESIFFDFLSTRLALLIIDKKLHLSIKNRFCPELQKNQ